MNDPSGFISIPIYDTAKQMPEPHQLVIVQGGFAFWSGSCWMSTTHSDIRPIEWPVLWWSPVVNLVEHDAVRIVTARQCQDGPASSSPVNHSFDVCHQGLSKEMSRGAYVVAAHSVKVQP